LCKRLHIQAHSFCGQRHQSRVNETPFNHGKQLDVVTTLWHDFGVRKEVSMRSTNHLQQGSVNEGREPDSQWRNGDIVTCARSRNHVIAKCKNLPRSRCQHLSRRSQFDALWISHKEINQQRFLHGFELGAEGRLRDKEALGSAGNILLFCNGNQISKMPEFE
jgi:hypothetical protein